MTVDEFRALPRPKLKHALLQRRLCDLLQPLAPAGAYVDRVVGFRSAPEFDLRVADVAYLNPRRHAAVDLDDNIHGAPDLVIEVLSPAKPAADVSAREQRCLETGAIEFWVVDEARREVRITSANAPLRIYKLGQSTPPDPFRRRRRTRGGHYLRLTGRLHS